ncbi:uncharacterized protein LOC119113246 [Pollicipes pollicipes]|uniref:uncharacterized protein LOC119111037 n=1 Tax=Pollicipes pollicipes TaxID=41117 RepID=UPI001884B3A5|nr:uncharacterized protein LOC119111037 [Pollicipes pollicipes]XP_037093494.1 uncharacterized protein LOC119113246 [Pollicipes pollicipes]XP_037093495.1 uncharacterized protein LOC119113246 [Pollicipes pollicipes]
MGHGQSQHRQGASAAAQVTAPPPDLTPSFIIKLKDVLLARSETEDGISRHVFTSAFLNKNPTIANVMFDHFLRLSAASGDVLAPRDFVERCVEVYQLISDHDQAQFYLRTFADEHDSVSAENLRSMILQAFEAAMWAHPDTVIRSLNIDTILAGVADSCLHGRDEVGVTFARNWVERHCPRLVRWLHQYVVHRITEGHALIAARPAEPEPEEPAGGSCVLESASASSEATLHPALLWLLMCALPERYTRPSSAESLASLPALARLDPGHSIGRLVRAVTPKHWVSLYSSDEQGLSANRLQHHVLGYRGPTLMLLRAEEGRLFCVAADCGWRDSPHCWGGVDCMALQLLPRFQVLVGGQPDVMFYNYSARGLPSGLRVGADRRTPAIEVDREMSVCTHSGAPFRLQGVEVWGCGAKADRDSQISSQKRDRAAVEQRRKVNIMADTDWAENPDRYLLEMSGTRQSYNYN